MTDAIDEISAGAAALKAALQALLAPEVTTYFKGYNAGLRKAIEHVETHRCASAPTKAALQLLKEQGLKMGGYVPYGYALAEDGQTLLELEAEQKVILEARRLHKLGGSLRGIARALFKDKLYPRPSSDPKKSRRRLFEPMQIKRMVDLTPETQSSSE
jgi:hypothetical protein